jgi:hypothetical protein
LAVLAIASTSLPVQAACGGGALFYTGFSTITSNPGWCGASYCIGTGPGFSGARTGSFWHFGAGDPTPGVGADNGTWPATSWFVPFFPDTPPYYYGGSLSGQGWSADLGIDGCGLLAPNPQNCTCVALADEYPGSNTGVFSAHGAVYNQPTNRYNFDPPGGEQMPMGAIPVPIIVDSNAFPNGSVDLQVRVDPPSSGVYMNDGCACGPTGYRVRLTDNPNGVGTTTQPGTRDKGAWTLPSLGNGTGSPAGPQPVTTLGVPVTIHAPCSSVNPRDVYLTTELIFPNGAGPTFSIEKVSGDSLQVECGPNLADPQPPEPPNRPRSVRPAVERPGR